MSVIVTGGGADVAAAAEIPGGTGSTNRRTSWLRYAGGKVAGSIGALFFMLVVNFFLFRVMPGDPVRTLARNRLVSQEQIDELTRTLGLDQSLVQQFVTYLQNTFTGEFGLSFRYRVPVSELLLDRLWPTLVLVGTASILSALIGVYIGMVGAWHRSGPFDVSTTWVSLVLYSMPEWWLGLLLIAALSVGLGPLPGLFPTGGLITPGVEMWTAAGVLDMAWHLTLPILTLTLAYIAEYSLVMRSSLLDEMGEDYLVTARAKGLRDVHVRRRHAARNAMLPTSTLIALNMGFVVSGALTIETIFSIPGLGLLTTDALDVPDYPVLQGGFLFFSAAVIVANLMASLLYAWLDPRVRA